jgi:hypothetical protein
MFLYPPPCRVWKGVYPPYTCREGEEINAKRVYIVASQKKIIYKENKGKSGIYRFICDTTGKSYIGSAVNLRRRFSEYFSVR